LAVSLKRGYGWISGGNMPVAADCRDTGGTKKQGVIGVPHFLVGE